MNTSFKTKFLRSYENKNGTPVYLYEVVSNKETFVEEYLAHNERGGNFNEETGEVVLFYSRTRDGRVLYDKYPPKGDTVFELSITEDRRYLNPTNLQSKIDKAHAVENMMMFAQLSGFSNEKILAMLAGVQYTEPTASTESAQVVVEAPAEDDSI